MDLKDHLVHLLAIRSTVIDIIIGDVLSVENIVCQLKRGNHVKRIVLVAS